tara:strand:- start:904 stop:1242 length:339 start_codon:yes stop_codon:yes gene_type:complete
MSSLSINGQGDPSVWWRENDFAKLHVWEAIEGVIQVAIIESIPLWVWLIAVMFFIGLVIRMLPKSVHTLAAEGNIRAFRKIAKSQGNPGLETVDPMEARRCILQQRMATRSW